MASKSGWLYNNAGTVVRLSAISLPATRANGMGDTEASFKELPEGCCNRVKFALRDGEAFD
jgi:hypothetical protein